MSRKKILSKIVAASTKVDTTSLALHETVVMNGKMAVILSKGEGWYTYLGDSSEYDDTFLAATARCFVEKVLAGSEEALSYAKEHSSPLFIEDIYCSVVKGTATVFYRSRVLL